MEDQKSDKSKQNQIKIIVVGSMAVGKTCLIAHYQTARFLSEIPSTCGSSFVQKKKIINGKKYTLNLWDTAGQEKYDSLTKIFTKNANIIILVYSITDKKSFQSLNKWLKLVKDINNEDSYVLGVAANKSDLYKSSEVPDSQGMDYANKIGAIFKSTSAKEEDRGIEQLIDELLDKFLSLKKTIPNNNNVTLNGGSNKKKEGGCCGGGKSSDSIGKNDGNKNLDDRRYSKTSSASSDNYDKNDDEDF